MLVCWGIWGHFIRQLHSVRYPVPPSESCSTLLSYYGFLHCISCVECENILSPLNLVLNQSAKNNQINKYIHVHTCTFIHTYMHIHLYIHTCKYTHTHTHTHSFIHPSIDYIHKYYVYIQYVYGVRAEIHATRWSIHSRPRWESTHSKSGHAVGTLNKIIGCASVDQCVLVRLVLIGPHKVAGPR
jgi:hypothetical protein